MVTGSVILGDMAGDCLWTRAARTVPRSGRTRALRDRPRPPYKLPEMMS